MIVRLVIRAIALAGIALCIWFPLLWTKRILSGDHSAMHLMAPIVILLAVTHRRKAFGETWGGGS